MYSICHIFSTYLYSQHKLIGIRDNLNLKPKSCCTIHSNKDKIVCTHAPLLRWWGCDGIPAQFLQYVCQGGHPPVQRWVEMLHHWEKQWEKKACSAERGAGLFQQVWVDTHWLSNAPSKPAARPVKWKVRLIQPHDLLACSLVNLQIHI